MIISTILAYYAGLRHDEIDRIVIADLSIYRSLFSDGDFSEGKGTKVRITVRRGKTGNARRSAYLHLLAPPTIVDEFVRYVNHRRALFNSNANTKKIALIGLDNDQRGYRSSAARSPVVPALRERLGKNGDLHTMRHCFANWVYLWHLAAKHRVISALINLPTDHWLFSTRAASCIPAISGLWKKGR